MGYGEGVTEHAAYNSETQSIVDAGRRIGAEVTVTDDEDITTVRVNAGPQGWFDVRYIRCPLSNRVRRTGAYGILAQADGTGAHKVNPANRQEIADLLSTLADRRR